MKNLNTNATVNINVVAGSKQDFALVRHIKITGSNYDIGKAIANIATCDGITMKKSGDPQVNEIQLQYLKENYNVLYQRIKGAAEEFNIELTDNSYSLSYIPQAEGAYGCTAAYYPPHCTTDENGYLCRNFDFTIGNFYFELGKEKVTSRPIIFELHPDNCYASLAIVAYDLMGAVIDGINEHGLAVSILSDGTGMENLMQTINTKSIGLHELACTRYLLDNCANICEAKQALKAQKHFVNYIPCHYIVADKSGKSFIAEINKENGSIEIIDTDTAQYIANHLLYKEVEDNLNNKTSKERVCNLQNELKRIGKVDKKQIEKLFNNITADRYGPVTRTLWYSCYNTNQCSLEVKFYLRDEDSKAVYSPLVKLKL